MAGTGAGRPESSRTCRSVVGAGAFGAPPGGVAIPQRERAPERSSLSYRIRPGSSVRKNVRRLARRELDRSLAALDEPGELGLEETVHDVRKRCKKVRGVLRLARPGLGREYARANAGVRDAARELSALRDAHATLATFDELVAATHADRADGTRWRGCGGAWPARAGAAGDADAERALAVAAERLAAVRRRAPRWSPDDDVAILLGRARGELRAGPAGLQDLAPRSGRRVAARVAQAREVRLASCEAAAPGGAQRPRADGQATEGSLGRTRRRPRPGRAARA